MATQTKQAAPDPNLCPYCQAQLRDKAKFCGFCGTQIQVPSLSCSCKAQITIDQRYCYECGKLLHVPWVDKRDRAVEASFEQDLSIGAWGQTLNFYHPLVRCELELRAWRRAVYAGQLMSPFEWWDTILTPPRQHETLFMLFGTINAPSTNLPHLSVALAKRAMLRYLIGTAIERDYLDIDGCFSQTVLRYAKAKWHFSDDVLQDVRFFNPLPELNALLMGFDYMDTSNPAYLTNGYEETLLSLSRSLAAYEQTLITKWVRFKRGDMPPMLGSASLSSGSLLI